MSTHRYPLTNLAQAITGNPRDWQTLATRLGQDLKTTYKQHQRGLSYWQADRAATRTGHHPATIWPNWNATLPDDTEDAYFDDATYNSEFF